jgi:hypothetical protein
MIPIQNPPLQPIGTGPIFERLMAQNVVALLEMRKQQVNRLQWEREQLEAEIARLRVALKDMKERVEGSWERRDLAPDFDLEAVENANKLLSAEI